MGTYVPNTFFQLDWINSRKLQKIQNTSETFVHTWYYAEKWLKALVKLELEYKPDIWFTIKQK